MKIGLLICGELPPAMHRRRLGHARLIKEWLDPAAPVKFDYQTFRSFTGKLPRKVDSCDSYIVSGSPESLLDNKAWMKSLSDFLLIAAKTQVPVIGLCFGHQALAQALGGRVARGKCGWELGVRTWKVIREEGWMRACGKKLTLPAINRDQVVKLPPRSVRIATSPSCPNGLFRLANHAVGLQGHPEMPPAVLGELIETRSDWFTPELKQEALASLERPTDSDRMAGWCANFIAARV